MGRHHSEFTFVHKTNQILDLGLGVSLIDVGLLVGIGRLVARGGVGERHLELLLGRYMFRMCDELSCLLHGSNMVIYVPLYKPELCLTPIIGSLISS